VDANSVGYNPATAPVDVFVNDTAQVTLTTYRVSALDTMRVRASAIGRQRTLQFEERRKQGFGSYLDSTALSQRATISAALQGLPGVIIQNASSNGRRFNISLYSAGLGNCLANIMVDGIQQTDSEILNTFVPNDFAAIEVYQQRGTVPTELLRPNQTCGVVVFWTKRAWREWVAPGAWWCRSYAAPPRPPRPRPAAGPPPPPDPILSRSIFCVFSACLAKSSCAFSCCGASSVATMLFASA
jgi:hypothetical protein